MQFSVKTEPYGHLATKTVCYIAFNQSSSKTVCEAVSELKISTGTAKQVKDKTRSDQVQLHPLLLISLLWNELKCSILFEHPAYSFYI